MQTEDVIWEVYLEDGWFDRLGFGDCSVVGDGMRRTARAGWGLTALSDGYKQTVLLHGPVPG